MPNPLNIAGAAVLCAAIAGIVRVAAGVPVVSKESSCLREFYVPSESCTYRGLLFQYEGWGTLGPPRIRTQASTSRWIGEWYGSSGETNGNMHQNPMKTALITNLGSQSKSSEGL